ncbi:PREDICTED: uncharacterized protein LOC109225717 isoform X1 [Nicotiana attenuata]|uniref:uncharacterized protein LOC109225717 isoform X1 n=1 Tax=Nicotiana attenuata TaxID=49451 RepID=UPI0009049759|nr:PREDICTED: uncharacterized protein LOC109225717 isoform X1 [Nicotiana attenuata]
MMMKEPNQRRDKDNSGSSSSNMRCPHCAGPLSKEMETSQWTVPPLIRDSFSMIGSAVGGTTSAFYGFNHVMPIVRRWIKGPMWLHFLVGRPLLSSSSTKLGFPGPSCDSFLICMCRASRRCCSSICSASIFVLPCRDFIFLVTTYCFTR